MRTRMQFLLTILTNEEGLETEGYNREMKWNKLLGIVQIARAVNVLLDDSDRIT